MGDLSFCCSERSEEVSGTSSGRVDLNIDGCILEVSYLVSQNACIITWCYRAVRVLSGLPKVSLVILDVNSEYIGTTQTCMLAAYPAFMHNIKPSTQSPNNTHRKSNHSKYKAVLLDSHNLIVLAMFLTKGTWVCMPKAYIRCKRTSAVSLHNFEQM